MSADTAMFAALAAAGPPGSEEMPVSAPLSPVMPYDILTPAQAAAYLQVAEIIVLQEAEAGRLPGQKVGGQWRFLRLAITEWLYPDRQTPTTPKPKSSKERMLALAGAWKDDPTAEAMIEEIDRQRKASPVGEK